MRPRSIRQHSVGVAVAHMRLDELLQPLHVIAQIQRRTLEVFTIARVGNAGAIAAIMQVRAGLEANALFLDRLVEILQERGIAPRLVGRMRGLTLGSAQESLDDGILTRGRDFLPLLELDDHTGFALPFVEPSHDHVDALGGLGDAVFDGDSGITGNPFILEDVFHVLQRLLVRSAFIFAHTTHTPPLHCAQDAVRYPVAAHVIQEGGLVAAVNQHGRGL